LKVPGRAVVRMAGWGKACYNKRMSPDTRKILERVASWPEEDQDELAEVAANIEARRIGVYRLTEEERGAVEAGLADARAGRFATDQEIDAIFKKARSAGK